MTLAVLAGLPAVVVALFFLWHTPVLISGSNVGPETVPPSNQAVRSPVIREVVTLVLLGFWVGGAIALRERARYPLNTLANLLAALREGDYSIRARNAGQSDALGEVLAELNALAKKLHDQRLNVVETSALLGKVMAEIDVAVFTFDSQECLRLVNRAAERLLNRPAEQLLGRTASELNLQDVLTGDPARTFEASFPGAFGRWGMRRSAFRSEGVPHQMVVLADLSRTLREEERQAWQRLLRVLGHELNNSLAPIKSIAGTLEGLVHRQPKPADWLDDLSRGLGIISARTAALNRFMEAYTQLARLPAPKLRPYRIALGVQRAAALETRLAVKVEPGEDVEIQADGDQLEQVLINLVRNGADAALESKGGVRVGWTRAPNQLEIWIEDDGPGIANPANLFVPFFTTKQGGSGIGLVLSRQIAEAHGGTLHLDNRKAGRGCVARLHLPTKPG